MVRIFCLTSITKIAVPENPVEILPYEDVHERLWYNEKEKSNSSILVRLKKNEPSRYLNRNIFFKSFYPREAVAQREDSNASDYKLTEICIGWKIFKGKKVFAMYLFRSDTDIIKIKMVRGAVKFVENKDSRLKDAFDLVVSASTLFEAQTIQIDFDIKIKVRCIKNTKERFISQEEEEIYRRYAEKLKEINAENELINNPLVLPNQSGKNVLRTKLSDISILIKLLCDPQTGSAKNVLAEKGQPVPRYCQQLSIWLKSVNEIVFQNIDISDISLNDLLFETNLSNLRILSLRKCKITKLSRKFLKSLPEVMEEMDFSYNDISIVTQPISRLVCLRKLDLSQNKTLSDIPWGDLPPSIVELNLLGTSVSIVPVEVNRLSKLIAISGNFHFVSWENLSTSLQVIYISDTKKPINEPKLSNKNKLRDLYIINAGLNQIDCIKLPPELKGLDLSGNKIKHFDSKNALPNLIRLIVDAETLAWENLSPTINTLTLSDIINIPNEISKFTKLMILTIDSKNLKSISWKDINPSVTCLEITGGGMMLDNIYFLKYDIERVKGCNITTLKICNAGLTEMDCKKLPRKIESLSLENNKLKKFDCKNSFAKLQSLQLNDNLITEMSWESIPESTYSINVKNNQLHSIGDISHFKMLGYLYASNNQISSLFFAKDNDWTVFTRFRRFDTLDLGNNMLSHLPLGFENLECLSTLLLNNNKFDYVDGMLQEKLWNRLPPKLEYLNLSFNNLHSLPCSLKRLTRLKKLEVVSCQLTTICSYSLTLITNRGTPYEKYMDIRKNPQLQNIPYIPQNISNQFTHPIQMGYDQKTYNLLIDNLDLINLTTHKLKHDFKEFDDANMQICNCCAKCGDLTVVAKPFKQIFTMDLTMVLELENGVVKKEYPKGKWRSIVCTRICQTCLTLLRDVIASEEFKLLQIKTVAVLPGKRQQNPALQSSLTLTSIEIPGGKRPTNVLRNIPFYPLQLNQFYSSNIRGNSFIYNAMPSYRIPEAHDNQTLPSIDQIYSGHRYDKDLRQFDDIPNNVVSSNFLENYHQSPPNVQQLSAISYPHYDHRNIHHFQQQQQNFSSTFENSVFNQGLLVEESNEAEQYNETPSNILYNSWDGYFDPSAL